MNYIGIDLGTSSAKLILMKENGTIIRTASEKYPLYMPQTGWSEQNPEDWWDSICKAMKKLMYNQNPSDVAGIGFGGQMHGLVILDKDDNIIRPAILWNDGRTSEETKYLNENIGRDNLAKYTANIAFAGFTAPKILWVRNHEPKNFDRISKIMLPKDYIAYKMTGIHCCDYSDASGMLLLDVKNKCWSKEMLEICGVERGQLPDLFESWQIIGTLRPTATAMLGLHANVKVCAGAGDNAAAAIGTGTVNDGNCNLSVGTSGTVFISSDKFTLPSNNTLHSFCHASGSYHLMGCILSAASCNKWWIEDILKSNSYSREQQGFAPLGTNEVIFAPYLMGERTPHNDVSARGAFIGLAMNTTRAQMTQAIMEGVAFAMRDSIELAKDLKINIRSTKICGGGAKSYMWKHIFSDVLGIPVQSISTEEGPSLGGAMLAAVGCSEYKNVSEASNSIVHISETIEPNEAIHKLFDEKYEQFRNIYTSLKCINR